MPNVDERRWWLIDSFRAGTIAAAFQRSGVYRKGATDWQRKHVRSTMWRELRLAAATYSSRIDERAHLRAIMRLADAVTAECADALAGDRFRVGIAQKALNVFLKYQWCAGIIPEPPHCPFDARIIGLLPPPENTVKWTKLDDIREYKRLVAAARRVAGGVSLARWELTEYNRLAQNAAGAP